MIFYLVGVFILLLAVFLYMFFIRHRSRGTIALHRHPTNERRRRGDPIDISTTLGIQLVNAEDETTGAFYLTGENPMFLIEER